MRLKVLITFFQKMVWFIGVWATIHEILAIKTSKEEVDSAEILQNSSTSNSKISETMIHCIISNTIFWKCVTRPFRPISVIALIELDFLLRSAQYCKKCIFLDNLKTITQEWNMETRQMTPFFSFTFSTLTVCNIHFWIWK